MTTFDVANKVQRAGLEHLKNLLGHLIAFDVFLSEGYQPDRRTLVAKNMSRINRAHERILSKMLWTRIDVCPCIDQDKYVCFRGQHGRNAAAIDSGQGA